MFRPSWKKLTIAYISFAITDSHIAIAAQSFFYPPPQREEKSCPLSTQSRSYRQTIVVIDESIVESTEAGSKIPSWLPLARDAAVGPRVEGAGSNLGVRERLSIWVARRDGSELLPLFVGCSPRLSEAEIGAARAGDTGVLGLVRWFVGGRFDQQYMTVQQDFRDAVTKSLLVLHNNTLAITSTPAPAGGVLRAIRNIGTKFDIKNGIPRIIIVSPFEVPEIAELNSMMKDADARSKGFQLGAKLNIDFGRADVYFSGVKLGDQSIKQFLSTLVLASRGRLVDVSSSAVNTDEEPTDVKVFVGAIKLNGGVQYERQAKMRIATSDTGRVVSSWIQTEYRKAIATPFSGNIDCTSGTECKIIGDGIFAKVWLPDPDGSGESNTRQDVPFTGWNKLVLDISGKSGELKGKITEPGASISSGVPGDNRTANAYEIEMKRDPNGRF